MNIIEYYMENVFKKEWNFFVVVVGKVKGVKFSIDFLYGEEFEKISN